MAPDRYAEHAECFLMQKFDQQEQISQTIVCPCVCVEPLCLLPRKLKINEN